MILIPTNIKYFIKNYILIISILVFFLSKIDFFKSIYIVSKNNIDSRMVNNYGYCKNEGLGFVKDVIDKFKLKKENINIQNFDDFPNISWAVYDFTKNLNPDFYILINYKGKDTNRSQFEFNKFKLIYNFENCYLFKKL
tara:strand:+ start:65 stop:481 length:417 start_codon:yes stop_codon:yes gene_type:complete